MVVLLFSHLRKVINNCIINLIEFPFFEERSNSCWLSFSIKNSFKSGAGKTNPYQTAPAPVLPLSRYALFLWPAMDVCRHENYCPLFFPPNRDQCFGGSYFQKPFLPLLFLPSTSSA